MRQVTVQVEGGKGARALEIARRHGGVVLACVAATGPDGPVDVVQVHIDNRRVGELIDALEPLGEPRFVIPPQGVLVLRPPAEEAPEQALEVALRSPVEVFLGGLQSIGSWRGFLGYAFIAGIVVWIGLFTNTVFLLVAAMLIAPFAGPAMNFAIGTARGDPTLMWRSLLRYFVAIAVTIAACLALSLLLRQEIATQLMVATSSISSVAALLPLAAGAAGAFNLMQDSRASLVSGAATGMLVAAALAPPAGLIGMSIAIGEWQMAKGGLFLLLLQLVGINLSGAAVFRLFGLTPTGVRFSRGRAWLSYAGWGATVVAGAALVTWQLWNQPDLQRSSLQQRAAADVRQLIDESGLARLVDQTVEFTRPNIPGQNTLLVLTYVVPSSSSASSPSAPDGASDARIRRELAERIAVMLVRDYNVTPAISVTVLRTPTDGGGPTTRPATSAARSPPPP